MVTTENKENLAQLNQIIHDYKKKERAKEKRKRRRKGATKAEITRIRQSEEKEYEKEKFELYTKIHRFIEHFSKTDIFRYFFKIRNKKDGDYSDEDEEIYRSYIPGHVHASRNKGVWSRVSLTPDGSLFYKGLKSKGLHSKICYETEINSDNLKEIRYELIKDLHKYIISGGIYQELKESLESLLSKPFSCSYK